MIAVRATVRVGGVLAAFEHMRKIDFTTTFRKARKPTRLDQKDHKKKQEGPAGGWKALAPSTVARRAKMKRRRGAKNLLGRLPNAIEMIVSQRSLIARSRVKWSMAHQTGATVGRGARLPRRQFLWISYWLKGEVRDLFNAALAARWREVR